MINIIVGIVLIGLAYQSSPTYGALLLVQGMILVNNELNNLNAKLNFFS
jgi:hypothetical protein